MNWKKKKFFAVITTGIILSATLIGCGSSESVEPGVIEDVTYEDNDNDYKLEQNTVEDNQLLDEQTSENEDLDINAVYTVNSEVLTADYSNNPVIQIGNKVLWLNSATIRDFINAGATFYDGESPENELNSMMDANKLGTSVYIGDSVEITLYRADYGEEKAVGDCIVGNIELMYKMAGKNTVDNEPDINCIYVNKGLKLKDNIDMCKSKYGSDFSDYTYEFGDFNMLQTSYSGNDGCIIKSIDGKIFSIALGNK